MILHNDWKLLFSTQEILCYIGYYQILICNISNSIIRKYYVILSNIRHYCVILDILNHLTLDYFNFFFVIFTFRQSVFLSEFLELPSQSSLLGNTGKYTASRASPRRTFQYWASSTRQYGKIYTHQGIEKPVL